MNESEIKKNVIHSLLSGYGYGFVYPGLFFSIEFRLNLYNLFLSLFKDFYMLCFYFGINGRSGV